jgi:hypothetical protein
MSNVISCKLSIVVDTTFDKYPVCISSFVKASKGRDGTRRRASFSPLLPHPCAITIRHRPAVVMSVLSKGHAIIFSVRGGFIISKIVPKLLQ